MGISWDYAIMNTCHTRFGSSIWYTIGDPLLYVVSCNKIFIRFFSLLNLICVGFFHLSTMSIEFEDFFFFGLHLKLYTFE